MINPGRLKHRVVFQTKTGTADSFGQVTATWVDTVAAWAEVMPLRGREFFAAAQVQQEHSIKITMRYHPSITPAMRVLWEGRPHDVTGVVRLQGGTAWMEVLAVQGVKDGR